MFYPLFLEKLSNKSLHILLGSMRELFMGSSHESTQWFPLYLSVFCILESPVCPSEIYICIYILFRLFKGASVLIIEKGMGEKGEVALALAEVDHLPAWLWTGFLTSTFPKMCSNSILNLKHWEKHKITLLYLNLIVFLQCINNHFQNEC